MLQIITRASYAPNTPESTKLSRGSPPTSWLILILITIACVFMARPFVKFDKAGNVRLAKWRKEKLHKELEELDGAEQYVLLAKSDGVFPCFCCYEGATIYLKAGNVWKYGITRKGEKGRYSSLLEGKNLVYRIQFTGRLDECLKEEKRKIYNYALLPENLARVIPLIRPPGNKQDN